jgi:hypothetical protein
MAQNWVSVVAWENAGQIALSVTPGYSTHALADQAGQKAKDTIALLGLTYDVVKFDSYNGDS